MVDCSVPGLLDEIRYAETAQRPYLDSWKEAVESFYGRGYRGGKGKTAPENHALEWFSMMRGQLLMGDPRVRWTANGGPDAQARAQALTFACNHVCRRTRMRDLNEQLLMDYGFKWAVALVKRAPAPGFGDEENSPLWPVAYRIAPKHFRYDPAATRVDARAWSGHLVITSRKKLMATSGKWEANWNHEALLKLEDQDVTKFRDEANKIPNRDEVAYWEIWVPDSEMDDSPGRKEGFYGTIYTVVDNQPKGLGWIRDPYPAFVPPWGPYIVGGDLLVPDESAPLGPLTATAQQARHLNRIKNATNRAVENYKQLIVVRNGNNLADMVKDGPDQWVFSIDDKDIQGAIANVQIGGATEQHFAAATDARNTLDMVSGITDMMRGNIDSRNKATQEVLAAQSSANRTSGTVSKFHDMITRIIYTYGYMIDRDDNIEVDLGPDAAGMFLDAKGQPSTTLVGGHHKSQDPEEFFSYDLELAIGSMERDLQADQQMRLGVIQQTISEVASLPPNITLGMDMQAYLDAKAEITGVREIKTIFDVHLLKQLAAMMLQQGQAPDAKPQQTPQPKFQGGGQQIASTGRPTPATAPKTAGSSALKSAEKMATA